MTLTKFLGSCYVETRESRVDVYFLENTTSIVMWTSTDFYYDECCVSMLLLHFTFNGLLYIMKGTKCQILSTAVRVIVLVAMRILFCSCLCTICSNVSDSHALGILSRSFLAMHIVLFLPMQSSLTSF